MVGEVCDEWCDDMWCCELSDGMLSDECMRDEDTDAGADEFDDELDVVWRCGENSGRLVVSDDDLLP